MTNFTVALFTLYFGLSGLPQVAFAEMPTRHEEIVPVVAVERTYALDFSHCEKTISSDGRGNCECDRETENPGTSNRTNDYDSFQYEITLGGVSRTVMITAGRALNTFGYSVRVSGKPGDQACKWDELSPYVFSAVAKVPGGTISETVFRHATWKPRKVETFVTETVLRGEVVSAPLPITLQQGACRKSWTQWKTSSGGKNAGCAGKLNFAVPTELVIPPDAWIKVEIAGIPGRVSITFSLDQFSVQLYSEEDDYLEFPPGTDLSWEAVGSAIEAAIAGYNQDLPEMITLQFVKEGTAPPAEAVPLLARVTHYDFDLAACKKNWMSAHFGSQGVCVMKFEMRPTGEQSRYFSVLDDHFGPPGAMTHIRVSSPYYDYGYVVSAFDGNLDQDWSWERYESPLREAFQAVKGQFEDVAFFSAPRN
jgi:hypothetical protein